MTTGPPRPQDAATVTAAPGGLPYRNRRVQRLRRLVRQHRARAAERAFVVEGPKLLAVALDAGAPVQEVFIAAGAELDVAARAAAAGIPVQELAPHVLDRVVDTSAPQPVVAVVGAVDRPLAELADADLILLCVDVRDPGNLGTVLRSAEAAGAGGVICADGTVDLYNPKCVRASAGALFHLRVVAGGGPVEVLHQLGSRGFRRIGAVAAGGTPHRRCDLTGPTALVLGNEGHGLDPQVEAALDDRVTITMRGSAESLNVGVAAAVLCFEADRQRRP